MNLKHEKIQLTKADHALVVDFVERRVKDGQHNVYRNRGGFKLVDLLCGALGEIAAYKYLTKICNKDVSKPDFTVHETRSKSFNADLNGKDGTLYHVKSQTIESVSRVGRSYLFQKRDPLFTRPSEKDYILLVTVNIDNLTAEILGCMRAIDLIECGGISEPIAPHLRENKCAIYVDELVKLLTIEQRWRV